jgi:hypothetical protein
VVNCVRAFSQKANIPHPNYECIGWFPIKFVIGDRVIMESAVKLITSETFLKITIIQVSLNKLVLRTACRQLEQVDLRLDLV